jgi:hypothetical protein
MGINSITCSFRCYVFILFPVILSAAISISAIAQTKSPGTKVKIIAGSYVVCNSNFRLPTGVTLNNEGTLTLKKNLSNQNLASTYLGKGTVKFSGTINQVVSGRNIFENFTISNASGVTLQDSTVIYGILKFLSGIVRTGNSPLTLGQLASVSGTPSASSMVATNGSGQFRKVFSAPGSFTFPLGDVTGTIEYSPVTLTFTSGTFGTNNYAGVNLVDDKYTGIEYTGNYLTRYWNVSQKNITNFKCNASFKYLPADVNGTENAIYCAQVYPMPWIYYNQTNVTTHTLSATGISSFGTFSGVSNSGKTLYVKVFLEGLYAGNSLMNKARDENGYHYPGNTADKVTVELHNASSYSTVEYSSGLVDLSITGNIVIPSFPVNLSSSYYLTIKHRNSIETTSALPVSFSGNTINYDFTTSASKAYGNNLLGINGVYAVYGGDVNQDDIVDSGDRNLVENAISSVTFGYVPEDVNGDGIVDGDDLNIIDNNINNIVVALTP